MGAMKDQEFNSNGWFKSVASQRVLPYSLTIILPSVRSKAKLFPVVNVVGLPIGAIAPEVWAIEGDGLHKWRMTNSPMVVRRTITAVKVVFKQWHTILSWPLNVP
jgi:hypothetical protein